MRGLKWSLALGIAACGLVSAPTTCAQDANQGQIDARGEAQRARLQRLISRMQTRKQMTVGPVVPAGATMPEQVKRQAPLAAPTDPSVLNDVSAKEPQPPERVGVPAGQPQTQRPTADAERSKSALPSGRPASQTSPTRTVAPPTRAVTPPMQTDGRIGEVPRDFSGVQIDMVGPDQFIITTRTPEQMEAFSRLLEELDRAGSLSEADMEFVPLNAAESSQLARLLTTIYTAKGEVRGGTTAPGAAATAAAGQQGKVGFIPVAQPNGIVIVGRKADLPDIAAHVRELDGRSKEGEQFKVFPLKLVSATYMTNKLNLFFADRSAAATAAATSAAQPYIRVRVEAIADERTNSVFMFGGPADLAQAEMLIERMDRGDIVAPAEVRYFVLKNAPASDIQTLLQNSVLKRSAAGGSPASTAPTTPTAPQGGGPGGPGGQLPFGANQGANQPGGAANTAASGAAGGVKSTKLRLLTRDNTGAFIESGILEDITLATDPRANGILVTAPKESMGLIEELIKQLDGVPNPEAVIKVFELKNADAQAMLSTLQAFFGQEGGQTGGNASAFGPGGNAPGFNAGGQNGQAQPRTFIVGGAESHLTLVPLSFSVDVRTNSLLVAGSPNDLFAVEVLILRLDGNNARERKNFVYRLNNIPVDYAEDTINNFLTQQAQGAATSALASAATGQALTVQQQITQDVTIVGDLATNSLVISASPRFFEEILKVIQILDRRPPQVAIQVLIAEVTLQQNDEFGIELGYQTTNMFNRNVVVNNQFSPGVNFNTTNALPSSSTANNYGQVGYQPLTNLGLGRVGTQGFGGLIFTASSQNVSVLLRALSRQQRLEVLSRPQLTTLDNRESRLLIGQQVPTPQGAILNNAGNGGGTTITTVYKDVGIILAVQPQVGPDGLVVMRVNPQVSSIDQSQSIPIATDASGQVVASAPVFNVNNVETTVVAADGQTVVVAGLIAREKSKDLRKVPYLGDLPYLGALFRTTFQQCVKRELIIVLTPRIIYCDEDVERVKAEETARMEWCLPEVYKVHGDIYQPAYPSVEGGDRCVDVLGQELPANLKLPPVGRPRARTAGGPDGAACCGNGAPAEMITVPEGQPMPNQPGTPAATPNAPTTPQGGPIVPKPSTAPNTGAPTNLPGGGQPSLQNGQTTNNIRMLPSITPRATTPNPVAQDGLNYPSNLLLPSDPPAPATANTNAPAKPARRLYLGGVSRNPTAPAVVNQLDQTATAPTSTMQR